MRFMPIKNIIYLYMYIYYIYMIQMESFRFLLSSIDKITAVRSKTTFDIQYALWFHDMVAVINDAHWHVM